MEISDDMMARNRDWDPSYLGHLFSEDFYDFKDLWQSPVSDSQLVQDVANLDKYSPIVEDISMDDEVLCKAVEKIENE